MTVEFYPTTPEDLSAGWTGPWRRCRLATLYQAFAYWTADAGTAGELFIEGTGYPNEAAVPAAAVIRFANASVGWWINGVPGLPIVGAVAGNACCAVLHPLTLHRIVFVGSGGINNQLQLVELTR